ncbi:MAG TPA: LuxR C-terminal-related transcriptional regulator [Devosia sp.]|nr:LuxR C-terminal-related transcriptional regulator [Devosia sp.]
MSDELYYKAPVNRDRLIHILDADAATCEALSVLFRLEGYQTAFSLDAVNFFAALERRRADVLVINQRIGSDDGLAMLRRLRVAYPAVPVFMLEDRPHVEAAVLAIKSGAVDVITKPIDTEYLVRAVRAALAERDAVVPDIVRTLTEVRSFSQLTPREHEVLKLITNGQSNKEAGRELGISPRTIEVHRARVMEKLGARNTADLMRIVLTR